MVVTRTGTYFIVKELLLGKCKDVVTMLRNTYPRGQGKGSRVNHVITAWLWQYCIHNGKDIIGLVRRIYGIRIRTHDHG